LKEGSAQEVYSLQIIFCSFNQ